jgi:hypothetical protein
MGQRGEAVGLQERQLINHASLECENACINTRPCFREQLTGAGIVYDQFIFIFVLTLRFKILYSL